MRDQPDLEELSGVVSAGLLAEGVVFASGRLMRSEPLEVAEREALSQGKLLLQLIASPDAGPPNVAGMGYLAADAGALETLRAVRAQAPDEDVRVFLERLMAVVDGALQGQDVSTKTHELETLQMLFMSLGRFALARTNAYGRPREDRLLAAPSR